MNANLKALRGNLERIMELLDEPNIERMSNVYKNEITMSSTGEKRIYEYEKVNRSNVELRQRLAMFRRESIQFEKDMKGES